MANDWVGQETRAQHVTSVHSCGSESPSGCRPCERRATRGITYDRHHLERRGAGRAFITHRGLVDSGILTRTEATMYLRLPGGASSSRAGHGRCDTRIRAGRGGRGEVARNGDGTAKSRDGRLVAPNGRRRALLTTLRLDGL